MPAVLQVRDLRTSILKRVSFTLSAAECIAVKGPSGAGKTLLLRAIADLDPNQGVVTLDGRDRSTIAAPEWRRLVGYVPELFPTALRMRAVGLCATAGRLVMIVLPLIVVPVFSAKGQAGVVSLIGLILLVETAIVLKWGVRTKGRSLESI